MALYGGALGQQTVQRLKRAGGPDKGAKQQERQEVKRGSQVDRRAEQKVERQGDQWHVGAQESDE